MRERLSRPRNVNQTAVTRVYRFSMLLVPPLLESFSRCSFYVYIYIYPLLLIVCETRGKLNLAHRSIDNHTRAHKREDRGRKRESRDFNRGQDTFRFFSEIERHLDLETSRNGTNGARHNLVELRSLLTLSLSHSHKISYLKSCCSILRRYHCYTTILKK